MRSTDPKQKCQALLTFNPPTSAEGRWIVDFFAPWIDKQYPKPAAPGEIRYCGMVNQRDYWVDSATPFVLVGDEVVYDFDPDAYSQEEIIIPMARTFIPSKVTDNPYLMNTGYVSTLQALPEPLRSQMLNGDFSAGMEDDPWQVIPTVWVEAIQARWQPKHQKPEMTGMGVDLSVSNENTRHAHVDKHLDSVLHQPLEL
ncbi:hypothetical protein [Suttonella ornithocola]|uniref:hypothetical protein n=1 Tax=Suttonella ornithocola TaxID=279832 RepID=UPI0009354D7B|nr:hypothetical protein [Suttonella ornithocola]